MGVASTNQIHAMLRWGMTRLTALSGRRTFTDLVSATSTVPPLLWRLGRLNHVAIAVPCLETSANFYRSVLGAEVSELKHLPELGVSAVFVQLDNAFLELVHPLGESSPLTNFMAKRKDGGLHHICLAVDDLNKAVTDISTKDIRPIDPIPKLGAHGKPVVFLHPKDCGGVLFEIQQA